MFCKHFYSNVMNEEKTDSKEPSAAVSKDVKADVPLDSADVNLAAPDNDVFEKSDVEKKKDARRERLLNNLKKGRETALANRKKKALYKKLKKQEQDDVMDNEIREKLDKKVSLENENKQLKERLLAMEMKSIAKPSKKQPEPEAKPEPPKLEPEPKPEPKPKPTPPELAKPAEVQQERHVVNAFKVAPW